jgi:hypothetical protein
MGCWDIFCFICGNSCHSLSNNYINFIKENYNEEIKSSYSTYSKKWIKKIKSSKTIINDLIELNKNVKWMDNCSILTVNNKVIHNVKETSCNITFCNDKSCITHMEPWLSVDECGFMSESNSGIFIHTDCWKFIKKNYNIELKFNMLPKENYNNNKNFDINYGDIENYWEQDFNFCNVLLDKKKYLCSSPLKNDKNIAQIKKNITNLKLKYDPKRIGPLVSATFYNEGDIKIGKNKYFWIKKNNKWTQINENPIKIKIDINIKKLNKKQSKYLDTLPFIGQYNTNPIFIISSERSKKDIYKLELLLIETYKDTLLQLELF